MGKLYLLFILFLLELTIYSQNNLVYDRYYLNGLIINPAIAGSNYYPEMNISHKKQWLGIKESPSTQIFSGSLRVGRFDFYTPKMLINRSRVMTKERIGLGISAFNDKNGPLSYTGFMFTYAYHVPIIYNNLSFGLSGTITQYKLNENEFEPADLGDTEISGGVDRVIIPNANFGIYYYNKNVFFGWSINGLFRSKKIIKNRYSDIRPDAFFIAGIKFRINKTFDLEPSIMISRIDLHPHNIDINAKLYFKSYNWISLSYKSTSSCMVMMGLKVNKYIHIGYAYEYYTSKILKYVNGAHTFIIGRNFGLRAVDGIRKINRR